MHRLFNMDCLDFFKRDDRRWDTIFSDCPDNIGLKYDAYDDNLPESDYIALLRTWLFLLTERARCVWFSYNARWWAHVGRIVTELEGHFGKLIETKPCVQVFTFGQCRQTDLGNNHRPLLRIRWNDAPLYPDAIRVPSWRQQNGDKRADPRGRVPSDVFDFPRVTGNSKQRRSYHPTQLHEGLVERCIKLTTAPGEHVLDPFGGTGTTLRVCRRIDRACTLVEIDPGYCTHIAAEHEMAYVADREWSGSISGAGHKVAV
jgi:site-specific DNA-methyltransferase (adenine-specific)